MHKLSLILLVLLFFKTSYTGVLKRNFYFEANEFELNRKEQKKLTNFYHVIKKFNIKSISIIGHTDKDGKEKSNYALSKKRAINIQKFLVREGLKNIKTKWVGENFNDYNNDSNQKFKNRSVTILITHKGKKHKPIFINGIEVKKGNYLNLPSVKFIPGKSILKKKESEIILQKILSILKLDTTIQFRIDGHVCCKPWFDLSENRAKSVYCYLIEHGISEKRLSYKGWSLNKPKYPIIDSRNRRVEIKVIG